VTSDNYTSDATVPVRIHPETDFSFSFSFLFVCSEEEEPVDSQKPICLLTVARSGVLLTLNRKKREQFSHFTSQRITPLIVWRLFPPLRMTDDISQPELTAFVFQQSLCAGRSRGLDTHA